MKKHTDKIRNFSDHELEARERELDEQIFSLKFQAATSQGEGLRKLRSLKKDRARVKTILRERQLQKA